MYRTCIWKTIKGRSKKCKKLKISGEYCMFMNVKIHYC